MLNISVITPTIRKEGLELVRKALKMQTERNFEWLIGSPFDPEIKEAIWVKDDFKGGLWTFNRISNKLIKKARADLIVSWQDYTYAIPEALEKFLFHHKQQPNILVTGVGNKYSDEKWENRVWTDPRSRMDQGSFYQCYFNDIEGNFCSVPKKAIYDVGGFDQGADYLFFGLDWYGVFERIRDLNAGYDFCIDQTNRSYSLVHGRVKNWEENNGIHGPYQKRRDNLKKMGLWPKLEYLNGK